jgi:hypothetical protein
VGEHGVDEFDGCHFWFEEKPVRRKRYTLPR